MQVYVKIITKDIKTNTPKEIKLHQKYIKSLKVMFDTPDNYMSKTENIDNKIEIIGVLDDDTREASYELFNWAIANTNDITAYRRTEIRILHNATELNDTLFRTIILPRAFVLDYSETFTPNGTINFTLKIRQKGEDVDKIEVSCEPNVFDLEAAGFQESTEGQ